jgi:dTDP-4-amino-4,6-dideoxygalactose transaminase
MKVPLLDLKRQYETIKDEVLRVTEEVYDSQYFILGPRVEALEKDIASYSESAHAVGVSSGTDAILVSLMAAGIGAGDRVITTPYSFFATAGCIARLGAVPVFSDIDSATYNIDSSHVESLIHGMSQKERNKLKAIIPVHLYGQCVEMDPLLEIAKKYGLIVIEDAAQAIGAEYKGRRAGSMGEMGCFSFFPSKNLGAFGDGGVVTTNSKTLCDDLRILRAHGAKPKYYHQRIGGNFRLDSLQAAVVSVKLTHLDKWTEARQENAVRYRALFKETSLDEQVILPYEKENRHIYNQFVIRVTENRDSLKTFLQNAGIGTEVYYPVPLHLQQCFAYLGYHQGDFPVAEHSAEHTLALPIYPEITEEQQQYVVHTIGKFYTQ